MTTKRTTALTDRCGACAPGSSVQDLLLHASHHLASSHRVMPPGLQQIASLTMGLARTCRNAHLSSPAVVDQQLADRAFRLCRRPQLSPWLASRCYVRTTRWRARMHSHQTVKLGLASTNPKPTSSFGPWALQVDPGTGRPSWSTHCRAALPLPPCPALVQRPPTPSLCPRQDASQTYSCLPKRTLVIPNVQ